MNQPRAADQDPGPRSPERWNWQLAVVRALASGFAASELAISITLVNEQVPSRRRGLLYSIVEGGWPLGVFLASGVYLLFRQMGWRTVFLFGVIPMVCMIIGRILGEGVRPVPASARGTPAITWFVIAVVLGFGQWTALLLPEIEPGQQLEAVAI